MVEQLLKRYMWLIDSLRKGERLTYEEISDKWNNSSVNDAHVDLTKRTFYNHCKAIEREFGIFIECQRGRGLNRYFISNPEALEDNSLVKWTLDNFSIGETLMDNRTISDKILLEDVPSGYQWLEVILRALKQNLEMELFYENFVGKKFSGIIRPLCVKLFKRRWYILADISEEKKRIFSLDRIKSLKLTQRKFEYPKDFDAKEYFRDIFGATAVVERKVEDIIIRTYQELPNYLRSLPMHHSQKEVKTCPQFTDFSLRVVPTFDFIQELLLHRDQLEVISPASLRKDIKEIITKMKNLYGE